MLPPQPNGNSKTLRFAVFDLDDTLYAPECGLWAAISSRIDRYLVEHAQVPPARVPALRRRYHKMFGRPPARFRRGRLCGCKFL